MKPYSVLVIGASALLTLAASAPAATSTLVSTADAFVTAGSATQGAGQPTANYGAAGALQISAAGEAKGEIQTLLKFDLAPAKAAFDAAYGAGNWLVGSITLQLGTNFGSQGAQPSNGIFNSINAGQFKLDLLANNTWVEGTGMPPSGTTDGVTFGSVAPIGTPGSLLSAGDKPLSPLGTPAGTSFIYTPVGNTNPPTVPPAPYSLSLEPSLLADVSAGSIASLRAYAGDTSVSYLFNSHEFGTAANRPTLIVIAVPEPGSAVLLGSAALIWIARRRRDAHAS